ncbi:hypothetical protein [Bordetella petrii]|uniref:hypothetical protein n=1 Tax=Bordetella petrii TaxID=94624 RepID=UPI001305117B|nr:hypothetical protein [Bordetella petrii]
MQNQHSQKFSIALPGDVLRAVHQRQQQVAEQTGLRPSRTAIIGAILRKSLLSDPRGG